MYDRFAHDPQGTEDIALAYKKAAAELTQIHEDFQKMFTRNVWEWLQSPTGETAGMVNTDLATAIHAINQQSDNLQFIMNVNRLDFMDTERINANAIGSGGVV
ncbi:MAG: hypothetical protein ACRCY8_11075 [Dermatophilaceae bacterium]